jgi:hypothetical protein
MNRTVPAQQTDNNRFELNEEALRHDSAAVGLTPSSLRLLLALRCSLHHAGARAATRHFSS